MTHGTTTCIAKTSFVIMYALRTCWFMFTFCALVAACTPEFSFSRKGATDIVYAFINLCCRTALPQTTFACQIGALGFADQVYSGRTESGGNQT
jgi:hypothetical protein